jgi:hypothetical protein
MPNPAAIESVFVVYGLSSQDPTPALAEVGTTALKRLPNALLAERYRLRF